MNNLKKTMFLFLFASMLLFAGCQVDMDENGAVEDIFDDSDGTDLIEELVEVDRVIEVEGFDRTFAPNLIEVEVGETIEFVFTSTGGTHDFVIPSLGVGTVEVSEGESDSFVYTFDEPGTIDFICSRGNHAEEGMVGQIIVS